MNQLELRNNTAFLALDRAHNDFAIVPIEEAFNWDEFARKTSLSDWYLVAFRSRRKQDADVSVLDHLDDLAHEDAATQPGFLFYFKGKILEGSTHLNNLSFCMWQDRECARMAAGRSVHHKASHLALRMYEKYTLERYFGYIRRVGDATKVEFDLVTD